MDQDVLVSDRIATGEQVVRALDGTEAALSGAFWNYYNDVAGWLLVVVPRDFKGGPVKDELLKIRRELNRKNVRFDLSDIKVLDSNNALVRALSTLFRADGINGIRAKDNWINNVYIQDAYIYRLAL